MKKKIRRLQVETYNLQMKCDRLEKKVKKEKRKAKEILNVERTK